MFPLEDCLEAFSRFPQNTVHVASIFSLPIVFLGGLSSLWDETFLWVSSKPTPPESAMPQAVGADGSAVVRFNNARPAAKEVPQRLVAKAGQRFDRVRSRLFWWLKLKGSESCCWGFLCGRDPGPPYGGFAVAYLPPIWVCREERPPSIFDAEGKLS